MSEEITFDTIHEKALRVLSRLLDVVESDVDTVYSVDGDTIQAVVNAVVVTQPRVPFMMPPGPFSFDDGLTGDATATGPSAFYEGDLLDTFDVGGQG